MKAYKVVRELRDSRGRFRRYVSVIMDERDRLQVDGRQIRPTGHPLPQAQ